jgi:diguanylate cyclase (GGDEF)-like protein
MRSSTLRHINSLPTASAARKSSIRRLFGASARLALLTSALGLVGLLACADVESASWLRQHTPLVAAALALSAVMGVVFALVQHVLVMRQEIQMWRQAHHHARSQATRDPLTGLPNRRRLKAEISLALARVRRGRCPFGLLIIDLDHFRAVNEAHGVSTGDWLLRAVGQRITGTVRTTDVVARLDGDQFAVVAELPHGEHASALAKRVAEEISLPFHIDGKQIHMTCHIGVAIAPHDGDMPDLLLLHAEQALHDPARAQDAEAPRIRYHDHDLEGRVRQQSELMAALAPAVSANRIVLHYQPFVDLHTRRIAGFEALARWWHAPQGLIAPSEFIPAAEAAGLMGALTDNLLRQACRAAYAWPAELTVSLNVSPLQMRNSNLPAQIRQVLSQTGFAAGRLEIEIPEAALHGHLEETRAVAHELKAIGVRLALDNFGAAYAGLRYLHAVPFDRVKIDAAFIRSVSADPEAARMSAAMIDLSRSLGIPMVAAGVETEEEAQAVTKLGCTLAQGWWFGRPIPANGIDAIFARPS